MKKLYKLNDVMPHSSRQKYDSVAQRAKGEGDNSRNRPTLLARANQAWENLTKVRELAERTMKYTFADDQWGDLIYTSEGVMTEREYIQRMGNVPLTDNMMVSIFSSITGLYDKQNAEPSAIARDNEDAELSDMMSATIQCNWQVNKVPNTLSHIWREFLNVGVAIARSTWETDANGDGIPDVDTRKVDMFKAFWEAGTDPNMKDLTLIGQLNDVSRHELYNKFAKPQYGLSIRKINEMYHIHSDDDAHYTRTSLSDFSNANETYNERTNLENISFFTANTPQTYRVIEIWTKESKSRWQCWDPVGESQEKAYFKIEDEKKEIDAIRRINEMRRKQCIEAGIADEAQMPLIIMEPIIDVYWYFTFMTPDGDVLCEGETPYEHRSHPYTLLLYPNINGKIYPYMSFLIDQQRNVNRLNIMNDLAIRSAVKGLVIYPEEVIPDDMTPEEFDAQLTSYRGVARYKINRINAHARPDVLTSNAQNLGIREMLQMKINMMQQVANVSGALQGKTPSAGTAASRYAMEAENSTTSLFTILNDFSMFVEDIASKNCELITQYYEDKRLIFGNKSASNLLRYNRWSARDVKFKMSIKETAATAAYQQRIIDTLNLLLERQAIDILQYLDNSPEPFAKGLAQQIRNAQIKQQLAQSQLQVPGADQQAVSNAEQMMGLQQNNLQQQTV